MSNCRELRVLIGVLCAIGTIAPSANLGAQEPHGFGVCTPRAQRVNANDVGCFIITDRQLGKLGAAPVFWHVTRLPAHHVVTARDTAGQGTIVNAYGHDWLLTIADRKWRPHVGKQVASIGPLPIDSATSYSALYMEASMRPGMKSGIHRHSGPEAWYTISGETCLETPQGTQVGRAGGKPVIVPGGPPMELTATGHSLRTSLVLILHDASQPPTKMETEWKPTGACTKTK